MSREQLDREETELLNSVESDEWRPVDSLKAEEQRYKDYAHATLRKDKRINIKVSSKDLMEIRKRAIDEGLPYQTLVASVIHKYVSGRLVERS